MIIATVNQKGGVGKSTIAVHLVTWFREQNIQAALVDADVQSSSSIWAKEIDPATPVYRLQSSDEILDEVKSIPEKVIIIDGPAGLGEVTRSILLIADVALIPCGPSVLDVQAASDAIHANMPSGWDAELGFAPFLNAPLRSVSESRWRCRVGAVEECYKLLAC